MAPAGNQALTVVLSQCHLTNFDAAGSRVTATCDREDRREHPVVMTLAWQVNPLTALSAAIGESTYRACEPAGANTFACSHEQGGLLRFQLNDQVVTSLRNNLRDESDEVMRTLILAQRMVVRAQREKSFNGKGYEILMRRDGSEIQIGLPTGPKFVLYGNVDTAKSGAPVAVLYLDIWNGYHAARAQNATSTKLVTIFLTMRNALIPHLQEAPLPEELQEQLSSADYIFYSSTNSHTID